ncbi:conserved phage C-terminal domain-containing protein [Erysipelothrix anatis]|uniref:conserved phage C-terminal domain-containing protein n=1 Tax=Erysipelothrix anatis TaxID=2683713 RepID=UPI00135AD932|nr:conserved phage C-terminal domain-containing protein [Erysipelothrix anatis]
MSTKFKIEKNKGYTMMSNHHLRNKNLTLKAKGLMSFMLSLPDTWDYTEMGLVSVLKEGRESIRTGLKELEDYGYLVRDKKSRTDGKFGGYDYFLYETPHRVRFTDTEEPSTVKPMSGNQTQITTDLITTEEQLLNNKDIKDNVPFEEIVNYLNLRAGKRFKVTADVKSHVNARFNEGFTLQDFKDVIDKKCLEWINDSKMSKYLQPSTLFGTKFQNYLNQEVTKNKQKSSNGFADMLREME